MRRRHWFVLLFALLCVSGCAREPKAQTYELHGQVLAVRIETNEILVKHEDIKGFMPAMTMLGAARRSSSPSTTRAARCRSSAR